MYVDYKAVNSELIDDMLWVGFSYDQIDSKNYSIHVLNYTLNYHLDFIVY